ncbi:Serine/threonine-protein kinase CTR1 [Spatholobus suberectus]|nr:Serine/threonine-protein kinase CTR1 [Spatholobus suberectus]
MEQSRFYKQLQCNTMEPRNEEFQLGSQSVIQDCMDGMHTIRRPSDYNPSDVKPVLNYSIQTGEEFALEFMRDRVNLRKPIFSNVSDSNSNYATGSIELKGISHAASESGSDISMLSKVEKVPTEFNRQSTSLHGDRSNYGSIRSVPRTSLNQENSRFVHGYGSSVGSDSSSMMMKCLCSFGGRILPRPSDGKLRYVGGQTRILRLRRDISWQELMQKALLIYNLVHVLKYQLPGEDLDALVSVSSDEDLQNMMEECNLLEDRERSQKLRLFLFSMSDLEDAQFALSSIGDDSEVQYVVAVNGMDFGSRNNSTPLGVSFSAEDLHELDRQTSERETSRGAVESIGVSNAPLTNKSDPSLTIHSSQPVQPNSSNAYEIDQLSYGDQMMQVGEYSHQYFVHHGLNSTQNPVVAETPIPMAPHLLNNQQGVLNEDHLPSGLQIQNSQLYTVQMKKIGDNSVKQGSDPGKVLSTETPSPAPSQHCDTCLKSNFPEASVVVTMPEGGHLPSLPSTKRVQHKDYEEASSTSSSVFVPAHVDSDANAIDLSCLHPPPLPERVYYSERTPREQVELLNRSSKSDDTHGSQIHVSDLLSDVNPVDPVTESDDNLHDGKMLNPTEELGIAAKPLLTDGHTIDNGFSKNQISKPLADTIKSKLSEHTDPELKLVLQSNEGTKDVETEDYRKDNHTKPLVDDTKTKNKTKDGKSDLPHVLSGKRLDDLASNLPEIDWGEASRKESNDGCMVQELPVSVTGNITKDVYQDFPPDISKQAQGDILIDIDDRFPRELLSDMFSKAILGEDPSSLHPLSGDGVGLSINMENHEPKRWSYFHKLAQEGLDNVSLIDQDHLGFSPMIGKTGDDRTHHVTPLTTDGVPLHHEDSHLNFNEENQEDLHRRIGTETTVLKSNYNQSQLKDNESMQFDAMMENLRTQESEFEDGKFDVKIAIYLHLILLLEILILVLCRSLRMKILKSCENWVPVPLGLCIMENGEEQMLLLKE